MNRSVFRGGLVAVAALGLLQAAATVASAETVMQQCGQQYQAAKAANTLNGMSWNQFRTDCAAKLKATPAVQSGAAPAATPAAATTAPAAPANPLKPAAATPAPAATPAETAGAEPVTTKGGKPMSPGRAAFLTRERQCGTEWKANKVSLVAQTPGLTWPKYLSQCNARLKAAAK